MKPIDIFLAFAMTGAIAGTLAVVSIPDSVLMPKPAPSSPAQTVASTPVPNGYLLTRNAAGDYLLVKLGEPMTAHKGTIADQPTREESALLFAIGEVESGNNIHAFSPDHYGKYQVSEDIQLAFIDLDKNHNNVGDIYSESFQDACALYWLRHLENGKQFNAPYIAQEWRGKYDADYIKRVMNIYALKLEQK